MPIYPNYIVPINGQSVVKERTTQIFSAKTTSGSCDCDLEALKTELKEYTDEKIETVNETINTLNQTVNSISNDIIPPLDRELKSLDARVETIEDTLDSLEKTVEKDVVIQSSLWVSNEAIVNVEGVTSSKKIDWGLPVPTTRENADAIGNSKVIITNIGDGTVTFSCSKTPSEDLTISIKVRG